MDNGLFDLLAVGASKARDANPDYSRRDRNDEDFGDLVADTDNRADDYGASQSADYDRDDGHHDLRGDTVPSRETQSNPDGDAEAWEATSNPASGDRPVEKDTTAATDDPEPEPQTAGTAETTDQAPDDTGQTDPALAAAAPAPNATQQHVAERLAATPPPVAPVAVNDLANGTVTPHFFRNFVVFDALGSSHELSIGYLKTATNTWAVELYAANPAEVTAGATALASGNVIFNGDASLDADNVLTTLGTYNPITGDLVSTIPITWTNGAAASTIDLDWGTNNLNNGLSQFSANYNVAYVNQNGASVGLLNGVSIDEDGFVIASFTNGQTQSFYTLPLSTFGDPSSLKPEEGNAYSETNRPGSFNLREAGQGGAGFFVPSALEASNVDIAHEFTDMIITQRAYSANARVITTADEMLEELIRLR